MSTLSISKRNGGGFPGMLATRTFNFIIVKEDHAQVWILEET